MKPHKNRQSSYFFLDRDLSWLSFNERVLDEAQREDVPLMERIRFLAIFSSNLDEFYRVRMPVIKALKTYSEGKRKGRETETLVHKTILRQQLKFGAIIEKQILRQLENNDVHLVYNEPIPKKLLKRTADIFFHKIAAFVLIVNLSKKNNFHPLENVLYILVTVVRKEKYEFHVVSIPPHTVSRFFRLEDGGKEYVIFLDDILKYHIRALFPACKIIAQNSFKVTRDAELDLDEYRGNLAKTIEKQLHRRDSGALTRFLYEPGLPAESFKLLKRKLELKHTSFIPGGSYHNLKELSNFPLRRDPFLYDEWPQRQLSFDTSLFDAISANDIAIHPPYDSYNPVIRFFSEAAIDPHVDRIYVTLYRVAHDSQLVNALISAARNGKKVFVFIELKARFDESNNIKWSKRMKDAGVHIVESIAGLKVHAKVALVRRKVKNKYERFGLFATGNFNEATARYYTDHIILTSDKRMCKEAEQVFQFLATRKHPSKKDKHNFNVLLVGKFNLLERLLQLIDREIENATKGNSAFILVKMNNLEEQVLIKKLYDASNAGVKITLIVRSICCLVPGVPGMSENITVRRIIDRYLEHGRVFIFNNNGDPDVYLGSADWMNRNIYRRIEVCFPIYDAKIKGQILKLIEVQLADSTQAVNIDSAGNNVPIVSPDGSVRSQLAIAKGLASLISS